MSPIAERSPSALQAIAAAFDIALPIERIEPLGRGLINQTFRIETAGGAYVLQRINGSVFPDPEQIMTNLRLFGETLEQRDAAALRIPRLIAARSGRLAARDAEGQIWRMMELIPEASSLSRLETRDEAHEVGRLLGEFHRAAATLPTERFGTTLPGFHDTPAYLARLRSAMQDRRPTADAETMALVAQIDERADLAVKLDDARRAGDIPVRITHGDPKLDNILFSLDRSRALALIDLDTIQPGLIQHDIGDCLRSCCNRQGEDARGSFDLALCEAILSGYAEQTAHLIGPTEIETLYDAIRIMPFELTLRFLTDHLEGDRYFRVAHRGQNLHKAEIQLALVRDIELKADAIRSIVAEAFRRS